MEWKKCSDGLPPSGKLVLVLTHDWGDRISNCKLVTLNKNYDKQAKFNNLKWVRPNYSDADIHDDDKWILVPEIEKN